MLAILHVASMPLARTIAVPHLPPAVVQQSRSDMRTEPACSLWPHLLVTSTPQRLRRHFHLKAEGSVHALAVAKLTWSVSLRFLGLQLLSAFCARR